MLVLNRRPGESIVIEPDLRVTVLSVADRRVWIGLASPSLPEVRVSATTLSADEARLEIAPMSGVVFEGDRVRITTAPDGDTATAAHAGFAVDRRPGERVEVGDDMWIAIASISKGNPAVTFGGSAIGEPFSITLIRPAGSYVRLGVDAPGRRVYREELWDVVRASGGQRVVPDRIEATPRHADLGAAVPVVEATVPVVEAAVPVVEAAVPVVEAAVPVVETAVPAVEAAASPAG